MTAIIAMLAACIVVLRGWPDLPLARWLHGVLVAPVVRTLAALTAGHGLLLLLLAAGVGTACWIGGDMIVVMAIGSPEIVALLATVEVAAYLDALVAIVVATGALRGMTLRQWMGGLPGRRQRARRSRVARPAAANDDDPDRRAIAA